MHDAENQLVAERDPATSRIHGTLLLGDGDRVPRSAAKLFGTSRIAGEGLRPYFRVVRKKDVAFPATTAEICNANDIVCDFNLHRTKWKNIKAHFAKAAKVHTSYVKRNAKAKPVWFAPVLSRAASWVAGQLAGPTAGPAAGIPGGNPSATKPASFCVSGDCDEWAKNLTWSSWTSTSAIGTGDLGFDDDTPNVAQGTYAWYPVRIDAMNPAQFGSCGRFFSTITFTFTGEKPGTVTTMTVMGSDLVWQNFGACH